VKNENPAALIQTAYQTFMNDMQSPPEKYYDDEGPVFIRVPDPAFQPKR